MSTLIIDGPLCPKEISLKLEMAPRSVSFVLRQLLGEKILLRFPNLRDMKRPKYFVNIETAKQLVEKYRDTPHTSQISPLTWRKLA